MKNKGARILLYVQHLLGVGHLIRSKRISCELAAKGFEVLLVTGGRGADIVAMQGVRQLALPSIAIKDGDFSQVVNEQGFPIDDSYRSERRAKLLNAYLEFKPQVVIIEAFPFGRRIVEFELLPLLETIKSTQPKPLLLCSLRDILQRRTKPGRDQQTANRINQYFDKVLVHGDPDFYSLNESFSCAEAIQHKILYTGMVGELDHAVASQQYDVIVSAGGGAVGSQLMRTCLEVQQRLPKSIKWLFVTGPNLSHQLLSVLAKHASDHLAVKRFVKDLPGMLKNTKLSISQAGYNTVVDVLNAGCRAIVVPYSAGGETEQVDRAMRLHDLGLATVISEQELDVLTMEKQIRAQLNNPVSVTLPRVKLDGTHETARIIDCLISAHNPSLSV